LAFLRLSAAAEEDLLNIGAFTLRTWGERQTERYLNALEGACRQLAANPLLGRRCDEISAGLRRMEQGSHVIFYREKSDGILVVRFLHRSMLPERHTLDDNPEAE
jgi:toxin ParE1/3/4